MAHKLLTLLVSGGVPRAHAATVAQVILADPDPDPAAVQAIAIFGDDLPEELRSLSRHPSTAVRQVLALMPSVPTDVRVACIDACSTETLQVLIADEGPNLPVAVMVRIAELYPALVSRWTKAMQEVLWHLEYGEEPDPQEAAALRSHASECVGAILASWFAPEGGIGPDAARSGVRSLLASDWVDTRAILAVPVPVLLQDPAAAGIPAREHLLAAFIDQLGEDAATWQVACALADSFPGTVEQLLSAARATRGEPVGVNPA